MLERTDRMLVGLKRGIDEMRGVHPQSTPMVSAPAPPMPTVAQQHSSQSQVQHTQVLETQTGLEQGAVTRSHSQQPQQQVVSAAVQSISIATAPTGESDRPRGNVWPVEVSRE